MPVRVRLFTAKVMAARGRDGREAKVRESPGIGRADPGRHVLERERGHRGDEGTRGEGARVRGYEGRRGEGKRNAIRNRNSEGPRGGRAPP